MFSFNNFPILPKPFSPTLFSVLFVIFVEMAMKKSILKEGYKIIIALPAISYARKRIELIAPYKIYKKTEAKLLNNNFQDILYAINRTWIKYRFMAL